MKGRILLLLCVMTGNIVLAQNGVWNNKKCAIALTYDDALHVHLDHAIPVLDSLGLKGTFYLSGSASGCRDRLRDWKGVAAHGHELANHTLFHPCVGGGNRSWVRPEYDLATYTLTRMVDEVRMNNTLLQSLDGKTVRTFAYPCGDTRVGDTTYVDAIKDYFVSARGVKGEMYKIGEIDLYNVGSYGINGQSGDYLISLVKEAIAKNSLVVFLFHGVGGEHDLNVGLKEHSALLHFLKENEKDIWVAPFVEITEYVKQYNQTKK